MIDPMTSRLAQIQYLERLVVAERAREQAKWQAAPGRLTQLIKTIGTYVGLKAIRQIGSVVTHVSARIRRASSSSRARGS